MDLLDLGSLMAHAFMLHSQRAAASIPEDNRLEPVADDDDGDMWEGLEFKRGSAVRWRSNVRKPKRGWQGADKVAVGLVRSRRPADGSVIVEFPRKSRVIADPTELIVDAESLRVQPGSVVHVRRSLGEPAFGWGSVNKHSVGMLKELKPCGECIVDFGESPGGWRCLLSELHTVPSDRAQVRP